MALATRCPNCHALFRVVADQLKLRGGLVRCGACQHVFDAIGTLSYIDDAVLSTASQTPAGTTPSPVTQAGGAAVSTVVAAFTKQAESSAPAAADTAVPPAAQEFPEPPAESEAQPSQAASIDAIDQPAAEEQAATTITMAGEQATAVAIEAERTVPSTQEESAEKAEAALKPGLEQVVQPGFLRDEPSPRRRGFAILFGLGALLLALLALMQLAVAFRADLLVKYPAARPALNQLCKVFRCTVNWPARGDLLAVVGSELQALPGTSAFELSAVVRNRGAFTLALPAIELTLTDTLNRTVVRKVFAPIDYLAGEPDPQARLVAGLEPGADLTIRIAFEARELNASGFVVYPFYL